MASCFSHMTDFVSPSFLFPFPIPYQGPALIFSPALIFLLVCAENAPRLCAWIDWRPVFIAALRLCLCELMWIVLLAGLIGTSFRNRLRSRIISSPSLGNFRDPGSPPPPPRPPRAPPPQKRSA